MEEVEVIDPYTLLRLPYELQQKIALGLDIESTLNFGSAAQDLRAAIIKNENFWRTKYKLDFGTRSEKIVDSISWFENYKIVAKTGVASMEIHATTSPYAYSQVYADLYFLHRDLVSGEMYTNEIGFDGLTIERYDYI